MISSNLIYIICPSSVVTGGTELLHQLCNVLNCNNLNAYMYYVGKSNQPPKVFLKYKLKISNEIRDSKNNIIVFPEIYFYKAKQYLNSTKIFWWLSVDNFFFSDANIFDFILWNKKLGFKHLISCIFKRKIKDLFNKQISLAQIRKLNVTNCYQSEYANQFIQKNSLENIVPLSDYINTTFICNTHSIIRQNYILYNPKKGYNFTKKLIKSINNYQWIPLSGMNNLELVELFKKSKLYIDFGNHPGKDRLPREAVINGCCLITGTKGAAFYQKDIPIPNKYKIKDKNKNIARIKCTIDSIMTNYELKTKDYNLYREIIRKERSVFEKQAIQIFQELIHSFNVL